MTAPALRLGMTEFWGERLFENANDLDVVERLGRKAGLKKLQDAADTADRGGVRYSLYAPRCSDQAAVEAVRDFLDAGVLAKLAAQQVENFFQPTKLSDYTCHGHTCLIFGACAMSLGCKTFDELPGYKRFYETYRKFMLGIFRPAPLTDPGKAQLEKALDDSHGFVSGVCYVFDSKPYLTVRQERLDAGWTEAQATPCIARFLGGVPSLYEPSIKTGVGAMWWVEPLPKADLGYLDGVCGTCSKETAMLNCGRCKDQLYCDKACQEQDWKRHKTVCRTPEANFDMFEGLPGKWINQFYIEKMESVP